MQIVRMPGTERGADADDHGDDHHCESDLAGIEHRGAEVRSLEQVLHLVERGSELEEERIVLEVVEVVHLLERGEEHPIDREAGKDDEEAEHEPEEDLAAELP